MLVKDFCLCVRNKETERETLYVQYICLSGVVLHTSSHALRTDVLDEIKHCSLWASPSLTFPTTLQQSSFNIIEYNLPPLGCGSQTSAHRTLYCAKER